MAVLCNDASLDPATGDPLEIALLERAGAAVVDAVRAGEARIAEAPFDSGRKRMSTLHRDPAGGYWLMVKGTPESVATRSRAVLDDEGMERPLDGADRAMLQATASELAGQGRRVLALARRGLAGRPANLLEEEHDLVMVGLAALRDEVRSEASAAVAAAHRAGIQVVMVTGDHPGTAAAVAVEVGIAPPGCHPLTGSDLRADGIPDNLLVNPVYARVDPEHKLALVKALQAQGHVVAVTGDGANDAPALRRADVGVAMGGSGSPAAREASDVVITDDNLATFVAAVAEGRAIYDNIRKVVDYLVAANLSEIAVVLGALLAFPALDVPLLPLQLLWINLVTDGLPALALGMDPADPDLMQRHPRAAGERLLNGHRLVRLGGRGLAMAGVALLSLAVARIGWGESWHHARSIMFCEMALAQLLYALAVRRPSSSTKTAPRRCRWLLGNRLLVLGVVSGVLLQILLVAVPALRSLFGLAWLTQRDWGLALVGALLPAGVIASRS